MVAGYSQSDPMLSARFKLERAQFHIDDLEARFESFINQEPRPFRVVPELDPQFPENTYRCIVRASPPRTWAGIAGDVVTNLRASLDHMVYALSIHWLGGVEPSDKTGFVWPNAFSGRAHEALSHLPDEIWREVEALQPYRQDDWPELGRLLVLAKLVNADKHRSIQPVYARLTARYAGIRKTFPRLKHNDRIMVEIMPELQGHDGHLEFFAEIGFPVSIVDGRPGQLIAIDGLRQTHDFIRDEVFPRFACFFEETPPSEPIYRPKPQRSGRRRSRRGRS